MESLRGSEEIAKISNYAFQCCYYVVVSIVSGDLKNAEEFERKMIRPGGEGGGEGGLEADSKTRRESKKNTELTEKKERYPSDLCRKKGFSGLFVCLLFNVPATS